MNDIVEIPAVKRLQEEAELRELELKVLTGWTLADAIREGASVTQQYHGGWISDSSACALGAAYVAAKARGYIPE